MISKTANSGGGPIIVLPAEIAHLWRRTLPSVGVEVPEGWQWLNGDIICDYDDINDLIYFGFDFFGWLPVEDGKALVLFTDEQDITFVPETRGGVIVENFSETDAVEELIKTVPSTAWRLYPQTINLIDGRLFLFDSAYQGCQNPEEIMAVDDVVVAQLSPGSYNIFYYYNAEHNVFIRFEKQE